MTLDRRSNERTRDRMDDSYGVMLDLWSFDIKQEEQEVGAHQRKTLRTIYSCFGIERKSGVWHK